MEGQGKRLIYESTNSQIYRELNPEQGCSRILKQLKGEYPAPEIVARFHREYELTRKLGHDLGLEGVIRVDSLYKEKNTWVITMEDFGGKSLALILDEMQEKKQNFKLSELLSLSIQACEIVDQIHQNHVIHKDLNPSNLVWNFETQKLKLIDFGISVELSQEATQMQAPENLEGTLNYISPEQTGRMNRSLDFRTDLYSLGVSFYQLFTGRLPFIVSDSLELIHAHLALTPPLAHEVTSADARRGDGSSGHQPFEIPEVLSLILEKLMSKDAERRYQSAHGLQMDLQHCFDHLQEKNSVELFKLGQADQLEQFHLSQHLFGREEEVNLLKESLERACKGRKEIVWVTGDSGAGKSVLVGEVRQWALQKRGYFVAGKFDLVNQGLPYSSVIHAFQELVQQLLVESSEKLAFWKGKLIKNLEGNGQLILDVIPEIELIIGPQPPVPQVAPSQARHRLQSTFQDFIRTFASPEQVLVFFLDDLQWADQASLDLLFSILSDTELQDFLFLGAYRNREVEEEHPLQRLLINFNKEQHGLPQSTGKTLFLLPLGGNAIMELLEETFRCSKNASQSLSEIALQKTNGNPFFLQQFLAHLVKQKAIHFNRQQKKWDWKIEEIVAMEISENVALLLTEKIEHLSLSLQEILQTASCLGNEFDLNSLEFLEKTSSQQILTQLEYLLQEGLLIALDGNYKYRGIGNPRYQFVHDQVQQAIYNLISEKGKQEKHKAIGQYLSGKFLEEELEHHLFDVVGHWNQGRFLLQGEEERQQLISLNYQAGKKAKQAIAFDRAFFYFQIAMEFFHVKTWEDDFKQTLDLYTEAAEVASLVYNEKKMEEWVQVILDHAKTPYDCIRAENVLVQFYHASARNQEAVSTSLRCLRRVGISFPKKPNLLHILFGYLRALKKLKQKSLQELIELSQGNEQGQEDILELMTIFGTSAYVFSPDLVPLLTFKIIDLSLGKYGQSPQVIYPYAALSMIHCMQGNFKEGERMMKLSNQLLQRFQAQEVEGKMLLIQYYLLGPLYHSLPFCVEKMEEGARVAKQVGDLQFVNYHLCSKSVLLYFQGANLPDLKKEVDHVKAKSQNYDSFYYSVLILGEVVSSWQMGPIGVPQLFGEYFQSSDFERFEKEKEVAVLFTFYFHKMNFSYEFGRYELALEYLVELEKNLKSIQGQFMTLGYYHCFEILILLQRKKTSFKSWFLPMGRIQRSRRKLKMWAELSPINFRSLWLLVEAEIHRVQGKTWRAQALYQEGIEYSRKHRFLRLEGLTNELAGRFYLEHPQEKLPWLAQVYLRQAHYCYQLWGALGKVKYLEDRYPELRDVLYSEQFDLPNTKNSTTISRTEQSDLNWSSLTKASQAISKEIELEPLCKGLLEVMLENIGAERGLLLMEIGEGEELVWEIKAKSGAQQNSQYFSRGINPVNSEQLSLGVFRYVLQTQESLILNDVSQDHRFQNDSYVLQHQLKSMFCLPILQKQNLLAIAYFENNLSTGIFVEKHSKVLKVLALQAAFSLENAKKHLEIQEAQMQLVQSEKMAGLGVLIAGVGHEIRNPLGAISLLTSNFDVELQEFQKKILDLLNDPDGDEAEFFKEGFAPFFHKLNLLEEGNLRLKKIVENLQNFSHMDRGEMELGDPIQALENTLQLIQAQYDQQVRFEYHFVARPKILCFLGALNQVFLNLVVNACQAIIEKQEQEKKNCSGLLGEGKLRIESGVEEGNLCIRFQDNGCGMSKEVQKKIFAPFFSTKSLGKGTGLGMHISEKAIRQHGGKIEVDSTVGEGTIISLHFPIQ